MRFQQPLSVLEVAAFLQAEIIGDQTGSITGINEIHKVEKGNLTFVDVEKYYKKVFKSAATFILINQRIACPKGKVLLLCDDPFTAYNRMVRKYRNFEPLSANISQSAVIHPSAIIEPNVIVGHHVHIGEGSFIRANAVIHDHSIIGKNVVIHSGVIIGSDAFYFKRRPKNFEKLTSCGRVVIHDNVEIGACCTIDKGVSGDTIVGKGTKLDNQVHLGHGVVIGKNCLLAAQVGIGGKTIVEDDVKLWGQVGVAPKLLLGKGAEVYAQSGVNSNLKPGVKYFGAPAVEAQDWFKEYRAMKRLVRREL